MARGRETDPRNRASRRGSLTRGERSSVGNPGTNLQERLSGGQDRGYGFGPTQSDAQGQDTGRLAAGVDRGGTIGLEGSTFDVRRGAASMAGNQSYGKTTIYDDMLGPGDFSPGPSTAYYGTDAPEPGFMRTSGGEGLPQSRPPGGGLPGPGEALGEPVEEGEMGYESAVQLIDEAAQNYMGVDTNTLDDAGWSKLLQDLRTGYPDDVDLLGAIDFVEGQRAATGAREGVETGTEPLPKAPETMNFNPDKPRY